ncbi:MAG TPA: plastocyanin/azurin family copper-binding protein [Mycobacteriales bacterium]|nr:plastocyanin/azurin family copper-binding protein [Mycobacteriales bacterium]
MPAARRALLPAAGLVASVVLAGCGGSSSAGGSPATSTGTGTPTVTIQGFAFHPSTLTVKAGTKVTFVQQDTIGHNVTGSAASGFLHSPLLSKGQTYTATFRKPGTYSYICTIHPDMQGKVIVK